MDVIAPVTPFTAVNLIVSEMVLAPSSRVAESNVTFGKAKVMKSEDFDVVVNNHRW